MASRTTAELPVTPTQRRIYEAWASNPGMKRVELAHRLGISPARIRQAVAVVRTKNAYWNGDETCQN